MNEKIKFTEEEINALKQMQDKFNSLVLQMGQANIELLSINERKQTIEKLTVDLNDAFFKLRAEENEFSAKLTEKYGKGMFDPTTGEFTPVKEPVQNVDNIK